jgi:NDP-sugar pyrophosphorylase family protein
MKAIILAGGQGMRLGSLTGDRPKVLIEVGGRPISEYQLDWLAKEANVEHVVFACGYKWEKLQEHFGKNYKGVSIAYSVEDAPLGTGGAIKKALSEGPSEGSFIVVNGDIITDLPLGKMVEAHVQAGGITASMLVVPYRSRFGVVKIDKLRMVRGFEEKPAFPDVWINGGVYILNARKIVKSLSGAEDIERETFPRLVSQRELLSYPHYGEWWFIDSFKELSELEESMRTARARPGSKA